MTPQSSNFKEIKARLLKKKEVADGVWFFRFKMVEPRELDFSAGQYLLLEIGEQRRAYSIASPDYQKNFFELIVRILPQGLGSNYLKGLKIAQESKFLGPMGFFTLKSEDKSKIFFAGGTGIAPIRSQIFSFLRQKKTQTNLILFWGLRNKDAVYFFEEFSDLERENPNFTFKICLDQKKDFKQLDRAHFFQGRVQSAFLSFKKERLSSDLNNFEYYLCGPPAMVRGVREFLLKQGVKQENIFFEGY